MIEALRSRIRVTLSYFFSANPGTTAIVAAQRWTATRASRKGFKL
jgi:hypothetical protein